MEPEVARSRPRSWRSRVLFPEPLPPMITMISPRCTVRLTPFRIRREP